MNPVMQTRNGTNGNCEAAAVASIMECLIDEVPQLREKESVTRYFRRLSMWLRKNYGVYYVHCPTGWETHGRIIWKPQGWSVGTVASDLGEDHTHALVCFDGKPVHDPLGSADNLKKPLLGHSVFVVYDLEILFKPGSIRDPMPSRRWLLQYPPDFRRPFLEASADALIESAILTDEDDASLLPQPTFADLWDAYVSGATDKGENPTADECVIRRSADAYCKLWVDKNRRSQSPNLDHIP